MLKKILRYDFKAVFKYWWIGAVAMFAVLLLSSLIIKPLRVDEPATIVVVIGVILLILSILCVAAFFIMSELFVFAHFYKNQFTDQGYLTFTLPLKRSTLLNSKLITGVVTMIVTGITIAVALACVAIIGFHKEIFDPEFWEDFIEFFREARKEDSLLLILGAVETVIISVLSLIFSNLFMFTCITIGAVIARKMKLLAAIGVYYAANSVFGVIMSILYMCGAPSLISWFDRLPETDIALTANLISLLIIIALSILCTVMYTIQLYLTDKKLNLA